MFVEYCTGYVDDLMDLIFEKVFVDPSPYLDEVLKISIPEDLCAQNDPPDTEKVIVSFHVQWSGSLTHTELLWDQKLPVDMKNQAGQYIQWCKHLSIGSVNPWDSPFLFFFLCMSYHVIIMLWQNSTTLHSATTDECDNTTYFALSVKCLMWVHVKYADYVSSCLMLNKML